MDGRAQIRSVLRGLGWALLALLIWAGWFGVTRAGVRGTIGVGDIAALRLGVGTVLLLPFFLPGVRGIPARGWREAVILSAAWGAPFILLLGRGIQLSSASHAAGMTPSTMPVFAGLFAWLFRREHPPLRRLLGFATIVAAVGVLSVGSSSPHDWTADLMLLAASAAWATYALRVGRSGLTALQATTLTCAYSAAVWLPIWWLSGSSRLSGASWTEITVQLVYQGVFTGALATIAFTRAVALLGPSSASTISSLVPVLATLLAVPLVGEWPTGLELLGDAGIAGGVLLATHPEKRHAT